MSTERGIVAEQCPRKLEFLASWLENTDAAGTRNLTVAILNFENAMMMKRARLYNPKMRDFSDVEQCYSRNTSYAKE
jgi:hypothetical protein